MLRTLILIFPDRPEFIYTNNLSSVLGNWMLGVPHVANQKLIVKPDVKQINNFINILWVCRDLLFIL